MVLQSMNAHQSSHMAALRKLGTTSMPGGAFTLGLRLLRRGLGTKSRLIATLMFLEPTGISVYSGVSAKEGEPLWASSAPQQCL